MHEKEATDVQANVTIQQPQMSRLQWIAVVGLGTVLLPPILYWMFSFIGSRQSFIEDKLIGTLEKSSAAQASSATAMSATANALSGTTEALKDLKEQQEDLMDDLEPLTKQLDRVADQAAAQMRRSKDSIIFTLPVPDLPNPDSIPQPASPE